MEAEQTITLVVKITYEPSENKDPVNFPITESIFNAIQYFVEDRALNDQVSRNCQSKEV